MLEEFIASRLFQWANLSSDWLLQFKSNIAGFFLIFSCPIFLELSLWFLSPSIYLTPLLGPTIYSKFLELLEQYCYHYYVDSKYLQFFFIIHSGYTFGALCSSFWLNYFSCMVMLLISHVTGFLCLILYSVLKFTFIHSYRFNFIFKYMKHLCKLKLYDKVYSEKSHYCP